MIDSIKKYPNSSHTEYELSVVIPTWNNLPFLKLCITSLQKNSLLNIQIIVLVNQGKDGTLEWLAQKGDIDYVHAAENIGICYGVNTCRSLIKSNYIVYMNDDMYALPGWDKLLFSEIEKLSTKAFMMSATMIEPVNTGNDCVVVKNYGDSIANFQEELLLKEYSTLYKDDWSGSTWPPNIMHIDVWDLVGGFSIEYSPGMYSDPDLSKKLYEAGVRIFKGVGRSLVYHFGAKSTKRITKNKGGKTFLYKWGITSNTFTTKYLFRGKSFSNELLQTSVSKFDLFVNRLKRKFTK